MHITYFIVCRGPCQSNEYENCRFFSFRLKTVKRITADTCPHGINAYVFSPLCKPREWSIIKNMDDQAVSR